MCLKYFKVAILFGWTSARSSLNPKLAVHASHPGPRLSPPAAVQLVGLNSRKLP